MPTNLDLQRQTERRHIELFLKLAQIHAEVEWGDRPDCVLVMGEQRVGLEHCEVYVERLQANRPHLRRLKEELQRQLEARRLRLHVQVHFPMYSTYLRENPREVVPLAQRLADLAVEHEAKVTPDAEVVLEDEPLRASGISGPSVVAFQSLEGVPGPSVQIQGGPVMGEGAAGIEQAVRNKERKLSAYTRAPDLSAMWLLVVTGESITQAVVAQLVVGQRIESLFDRVYLLDTAERKVILVKGGA